MANSYRADMRVTWDDGISNVVATLMLATITVSSAAAVYMAVPSIHDSESSISEIGFRTSISTTSTAERFIRFTNVVGGTLAEATDGNETFLGVNVRVTTPGGASSVLTPMAGDSGTAPVGGSFYIFKDSGETLRLTTERTRLASASDLDAGIWQVTVTTTSNGGLIHEQSFVVK